MTIGRGLLAGLSVIALTAATSAAHAQDGATEKATLSCGVVLAPWLGGTPETDLATAEAPLREQITGSGEQSRAFRLTTAQPVRLEARTNSDSDPWLRLFDSTGRELGYNDDMPQSLNAQYESQLGAGDYCVTFSDASSEFDMTVQVGRQDQPPLIESTALACTPETQAEQMAQGPLDAALAQGKVAVSTDTGGNAYFRMTIAAPVSMSLRATADGDVDPQVAVFDEYGQMIASNDDADGRNARLDFSPDIQPGEYCVGVGSVSASQGPIALSASKLDPREYMRQAHARGEVPPMGDSYPVKDLSFASAQGKVVLQGGEANWFRFQITERSVIAIHTMGSVSGVDTKLALFDALGSLMQENDDNDSGRDAKIAPVVLQPGSYMLALSDAGTTGQMGVPLRPVVVLAERFVRSAD